MRIIKIVTKYRVVHELQKMGYNPSVTENGKGHIHLRLCTNLYSTAEETYNDIRQWANEISYLEPITWEWEDKLAKRRAERERRKSINKDKGKT